MATILTATDHSVTDGFRGNSNRSPRADLEAAADMNEPRRRFEVDEATPLLRSQLWQQQHAMAETMKDSALRAKLLW